LAVILPAILILFWLAPFVDRISHNRSVVKIRKDIQLGLLNLILYATWSYGAIANKGWLELLLGIAAFTVLVGFEGKLHPICLIMGCGVVGLLFLCFNKLGKTTFKAFLQQTSSVI
jgi:chromate transport protein ChrA